MKNKIFLILFSFVFTYAQDTIKVDIKPNSYKNTTPYINKILKEYQGKKNVVLVFEKGRYDFWPQYATEKKYYELNTTISHPRYCAIVIEKMENFTIDCGGSEFIFHGKMQPFTIDSSKNVTVKNVSVDWDVPFGAEAEIVNVQKDYFDIKIDENEFNYLVENSKLYFTGEGWKELWGGVKWNDPMQFDRETLRVTAGTDDDLLGGNWEKKYSAIDLGNGLVRINYNKNELLQKGNYLLLRIGVRDHSGFFMVDSKDILLENIWMYSNTGMNFLAQFTENITYRNVHCLPNPDKRKILAGHDDGFHHTSCKGLIKAENCSFKGNMDDSFNAYGTCVRVIEILNERKLLCKFMHHQSLGVIWARPNELVGFTKRNTLETVNTGIVESFVALDSVHFEITFKKTVPKEIQINDVLENLTWTPDVLITNCHFYSHRARSILVSTSGKVLIDNNIFESSSAAIVIPGDANGWFESGPVKDVIIRNNLFKDCNSSFYQFSNAVISVHPEIPELDLSVKPYHRNIKVVGNTFESFDYPVFFALNTDGVSFNNNLIKRSYTYKPRHETKYTLTFDACRNIEVKENKFEGDVLGKNIQLIRTKRTELNLDKQQGFDITNMK